MQQFLQSKSHPILFRTKRATLVTNALCVCLQVASIAWACESRPARRLGALDCLHSKGMEGVRKHTGRMSTPPPSPAGSGYVAQAADAAGSSAAPASLAAVEVEDKAAARAREWSKAPQGSDGGHRRGPAESVGGGREPEAGAVGSRGRPGGRQSACFYRPLKVGAEGDGGCRSSAERSVWI